jgi:hypothetical protein
MCEFLFLLLQDPFVEIRDVKLAINILGNHMLPGQTLTVDLPDMRVDLFYLVNEDKNLIGLFDNKKIVIKRVSIKN